MAAIRKRPKVCTHPTCQEGECGKCPYNPRSNYTPYHFGSGSEGKSGILLPGWLAIFVGGVAGLTAAQFGNIFLGFLFCVVAVFASLGAILRLSSDHTDSADKPRENSPDSSAP